MSCCVAADRSSFWEALRRIRWLPVERASGFEVPVAPITYGFEPPGQVVQGQHRSEPLAT